METILFNYREESYPERQKQEDAYIAGLDPLGADGKIRALPALNAANDLNGITKLLYSILPSPVQLRNFDYYESVAAMRDIGFVLGSVKRLGKEPVEQVPELDFVLEELSLRTNLPPRDTLLHYSVWNPEGLRQRSYTNTPDEFYLIQSVRIAMNPVINAIYQLCSLHELDPGKQTFAEKAEEVAASFKKMIEAMVLTRRQVSPEVFATKLRFYFDPIKVHGKDIIGPGAVELPMFVYDQLLWVGDVEHKAYREFQQTYLPFILPQLRAVYERYASQEALIDKVEHALRQPGIYDPRLLQSAKALQKLLKQIVSFRMPHKKVAKAAYAHEKSSREKGSGGYSTSILETIIDLSMSKIKPFEEALQQYAKRGNLIDQL